MQVLKIQDDTRIKSGAIQFVDSHGQLDWPGLFIRGDDALSLVTAISEIAKQLHDQDPTVDSKFWYQVYFKQLTDLANDISKNVVMRKGKTDDDNRGPVLA